MLHKHAEGDMAIQLKLLCLRKRYQKSPPSKFRARSTSRGNKLTGRAAIAASPGMVTVPSVDGESAIGDLLVDARRLCLGITRQ